MNKKNHTAEYIVDLEYADIAEALLTCHTEEGWEEEALPSGHIAFRVHAISSEDDTQWHAHLTTLMEEQCKAVFSYTIADVVDWIALWKERCTPVDVGCFYVVPEWNTLVIPEGKLPIYITPKMAFGTGHHSTTALCLQAITSLRALCSSGVRFLDVGTGSGILAIACASLGANGIAVDIDSIAIENAKENIEHNNCSDTVTLRVGDIYTVDECNFSLIIANILAEPLVAIAEEMARKIAIGGICILSGLLSSQTDSIRSVYSACGFVFTEEYQEGEWVALIFSYEG